MDRLKEIIKKAKAVSLTRMEKEEVRRNLIAAMGLKPEAAAAGWSFKVFRPVLAGFLAVAVLGGGAAFASENSLPGEFLYPVKVGLTEEVRSALSFSDEAKAEWAAERAERRLEEAEKLASKDALSEERKNKIQEKFIAHAEKAKEKIADLEQRAERKKAAKIGGRLEGSLKAHGKILKKFRAAESLAEQVEAAALAGADAEMAVPALMMAAELRADFRSEDDDDEFEETRERHREEQEKRVLLKARKELQIDLD